MAMTDYGVGDLSDLEAEQDADRHRTATHNKAAKRRVTCTDVALQALLTGDTPDGSLLPIVQQATKPHVPQPLPANSRQLKSHRVEAWIGVPHPDRSSAYRQVNEGRFTSTDAARRWAEDQVAQHPDSHANLSYYSARSGWQPRHIGRYAKGADGRYTWTQITTSQTTKEN